MDALRRPGPSSRRDPLGAFASTARAILDRRLGVAIRAPDAATIIALPVDFSIAATVRARCDAADAERVAESGRGASSAPSGAAVVADAASAFTIGAVSSGDRAPNSAHGAEKRGSYSLGERVLVSLKRSAPPTLHTPPGIECVSISL